MTLPSGRRRVSYWGRGRVGGGGGRAGGRSSTFVHPPWDQGCVVVGVAEAWRGLAALGGAAAVADAHRDAHRLGVQAAFAADVEDLALPAEDDRDDAGGAGEAAGLGGGDAAAGVEGADACGVEVGQELFEGHGDHDGGRAAAGLGELVGGVGLDQLGEGDAVADRGGQVGVDARRRGLRCRRWRSARRGDREDHLGQHLSVPGGDAEPAVAGAFVVLEHRERRPAQRFGFFGLEGSGRRTSRPGRGRSPRRSVRRGCGVLWRRGALPSRPGGSRPAGVARRRRRTRRWWGGGRGRRRSRGPAPC